MYSKILLALDKSDDARRAAERVIEIAKNKDIKVVLFHSIEHRISDMLPPIALTVGVPTSHMLAYEDLREARRIEGKNLLDDTKKIFERENISTESRLIASETPEDYITRIVDEEGFDLVVLGCKGEHSFAKRVLMGTIPQIALNRASCDVLIVR
jgi:nucleotide-binding universal stress UspA family protein